MVCHSGMCPRCGAVLSRAPLVRDRHKLERSRVCGASLRVLRRARDTGQFRSRIGAVVDSR
jgi:hypothetical protein